MNLYHILLFAAATRTGRRIKQQPVVISSVDPYHRRFLLLLHSSPDEKEQGAEKVQENLKKGDKVITIGGAHGKSSKWMILLSRWIWEPGENYFREVGHCHGQQHTTGAK